MLFIGDISKFDETIKKNIQLGLREDKIVPCFVYEGNYKLRVGLDIKNERDKLSEIIEEVCYLELSNKIKHQVLITREVGQSRSDRLPNSRISYIEYWENEIVVWRPLLSEIFEGLKLFYDLGNKYILDVFTEVSENLVSNRDFKVIDVINKHHHKKVQEITPVYQIYINNFSVNIEAFFLLIKHIMITEDVTYNGDGQLGRYLMQLAMYDYIVYGMEIENVLSKYRLKS